MRDYRKEFKEYCLTCTAYDIKSRSDSTTRGYRCKTHHRPMSMTESCTSHSFDHLRSNEMIDEAVAWRVKVGYSPVADKGNWYITTLVCSVLDLEENCEYLTGFKTLKDMYMATNAEGILWLAQYDVLGPKISEELLARYNNPDTQVETRKLISVLENDYLAVMVQLVNAGDMDKAMRLYMEMTSMLANRLGIASEVMEIEPNAVEMGTLALEDEAPVR